MIRRIFPYALACIVCFVLLITTKPNTFADTTVYVADVDVASTGQFTGVSPLWEFGHVLWRPLAAITWRATRPLTVGWSNGDARSEILVAFSLLSVITAFGIAIVCVAIGRMVGLSSTKSVALAAIFLCLNSVINFAQTGAPYVPGLFAQLVAVYFLLRAARPDVTSWRSSVIAGFFLALSVLLWFPYVLTTPGIAILGRRREPGTLRQQWSGPIAALCIAGMMVILAYTAIAVGNGLHTPDKFMAWFRSSSHGWDQNRKWLRFLNGFTRAFVDLGNDGVLMKRFFFHDPYAPVSFRSLLFAGLWKIFLVGLTMAALLYGLWRRNAKDYLVALGIAFVPLFFFSVFIFEPGSMERMLPLFATLVVASAIALRDWDFRQYDHKLLAIGVVVIVVINLFAYQRLADAVRDNAVARLSSIYPRLTPASRVVLLSTTSDDIPVYYSRYPLEQTARRMRLPSYHLIEAGLKSKLGWRAEFAEVARETWAKGGSLWISDRLLRDRPLPEWNWVEGDDPSLKWKDFPGYFTQFHAADVVGGSDGFVLIPDQPHNRAILESAKPGA
jgi:hypothetical protein